MLSFNFKVIDINKDGLFSKDHSLAVDNLIEYFIDGQYINNTAIFYTDLLNVSDEDKLKIIKSKIIDFYQDILLAGDDNRKKGRIGEMLLNSIASKVYKCKMVVPRYKFRTSMNQEVFGADGVYMNNKSIFFGESKMTSDLSSGLNALNRDIKKWNKGHIISTLRPIGSFKMAYSGEEFANLFDHINKLVAYPNDFFNEFSVHFLGMVLYEADSITIKDEVEKIFRKNIYEIDPIMSSLKIIFVPHNSYNNFINILSDRLKRI